MSYHCLYRHSETLPSPSFYLIFIIQKLFSSLISLKLLTNLAWPGLEGACKAQVEASEEEGEENSEADACTAFAGKRREGGTRHF